MKKTGFTLSELLIALTIIAVASALVLPALNNIIPDKNKARVLKYYSLIKKTTDDLLDNETIYFSTHTFNSSGTSLLTNDCNGLSCTDAPIAGPYRANNYQGVHKYPNLLKTIIFSDINGNSTPDGAIWDIKAVNTADLSEGYKITIDMNGANSPPNTSYSSTCKKPDTFIFMVSEYGDITPGDPLTATFLRNPSRTSKKEDFEEASNAALFIY